MIIDDDAKVFISWDATLTADPTGSTVELEIDGTLYPAAWVGSPVQAGAVWTQTARTTEKVAGTSAAVTTGDIALGSPARHLAQFIVRTTDGQVIPGTGFAIDRR